MLPELVLFGAYAVFFGFVAVFGWMAGRGSHEDHEVQVRILGFSRRARGASILFVVVSIVVTVMLLRELPKQEDELLAARCFLIAFNGLAGYTLAETFGSKWTLTCEGIESVSWRHGPRFIPWAEVEKVAPHPWFDGWIVRSSDTMTIYVPGELKLDSFEWFTEACQEFLSPERYPSKWR